MCSHWLNLPHKTRVLSENTLRLGYFLLYLRPFIQIWCLQLIDYLLYLPTLISQSLCVYIVGVNRHLRVFQKCSQYHVTAGMQKSSMLHNQHRNQLICRQSGVFGACVTIRSLYCDGSSPPLIKKLGPSDYFQQINYLIMNKQLVYLNQLINEPFSHGGFCWLSPAAEECCFCCLLIFRLYTISQIHQFLQGRFQI